MAYQALKGITVTPRGSYNLGRFGPTMENGAWSTSFAFGGWIYNTTCDIGFSSQPTEIKLNIVLEAENKIQKSAVFDIQSEDLRCEAGSDGAESSERLYDIDFNGIKFTDFILYGYDISIESNVKVLNVTFKDYSMVLDKIYIGLIKRQGNTFVHNAYAKIQFPVICPDCLLSGDSVTTMGQAYRDISLGSYVGINGATIDNLSAMADDAAFPDYDPANDTSRTNSVHKSWKDLFDGQPEQPFFSLNGGFLIIGTEDASEERCGNLANVSYNFNQLLASLRKRGMKFEGVFPRQYTDLDFAYKQNYIGTLREVLQQWCSDLGYDFYCNGKTFIGINLNRPIDISEICKIPDPTSALGSNFSLSKNAAIVSFKEHATLANTYQQSVITANALPRNSKIHQKTPKRYIGFSPLHPIDFNMPCPRNVTRYDIYEQSLFTDTAIVNSFLPGSPDLQRTFSLLDGRTFQDIDISMALGHYDSDLRDIYCQDRALYGETSDIRQSNFRALGMVPLVEITGWNEKAMAIEKAYSYNPDAGDEIGNICHDSRYYRVFVGYYYPKYKEDIVSWEQNGAENMYKFGAITKGLIRGCPYMPRDTIVDVSPTFGLYGTQGTSLIRVENNYEPRVEQYYDLRTAPYKDLVVFSGMLNPDQTLSPDMWIGELTNDWGLTQEQFKQAFELNIEDDCVNSYAQEPSYTDIKNHIPSHYQDWKLGLFRPQIIGNLQDFFTTYSIEMAKISGMATIDRTVQTYYDLHYHEKNTCSKLHIMVLPDVRQHPNLDISFTPRGREFVNPVVLQNWRDREKEMNKRRIRIKTPSVCDKSLLQEMNNNIVAQKNYLEPNNPRWACAFEDLYDVLEEGFDLDYLSQCNSRGLQLTIRKNPTRNLEADKMAALFKNADINGSFYYLDTIEGDFKFNEQMVDVSIIYPISVEAGDNIYYRGILTSDVQIENRCPESVEIYGEPVSINTTAGVKVINNNVDSDIQPQLDPYSSRFLSYLTVISGESEQVLTNVHQYHDMVKQLNNYQVTGISRSVDMSLAGTPDFFGNFKDYLNPLSGLNKMSISVTDNGVVTSLTFANRPPQLPKQESILNKIGPRIL